MKNAVYLFAFFWVQVFFGTAIAQETQSNQSVPQKIEWKLQNQQGKWFTEQDFIGKPLIITIWGTWCPHCKHLHPELQRLSEKYQDEGLQILGISVNEEPNTNPEAELRSRGITFPTLVNGDEVAIEKFGAYGTPTTLFIAPDGTLLGQTMQSSPLDPRFEQVSQYMLSLIEETENS